MKRSHQVNIETLKAGDETIAKQLAKLIQNAANKIMVIFFRKGT